MTSDQALAVAQAVEPAALPEANTNSENPVNSDPTRRLCMYYINPTREQFDEFKALPRDTPIMMLNLIRLKETATYEDGETCTGAEAYRRYGELSGPIFRELGGKIIWRGRQECMVTGPDDKQWDIAFVAQYPNAGAFLAMVTNPDYQAVVKHRTAGVLDSRLIRFAPEEGGEGFA